MPTPYKILILGASYGSLLATKLLSPATRRSWSACPPRRS